jgi:NAD(P)-dependent dehydrogenase (short-subunit alcohol dehydrogenase family)
MDKSSRRVILVFGAAGNLGQATVNSFLAEGNYVACVDRKMGRLKELYPQSVESKKHIFIDSIDSTNLEDVEKVVDAVVKRFGRIDVLVNTVGGYRAGEPLHETSLETLDFLHNLNVRSTFIACKSVIPQMLKQGSGKIINLAARPGITGRKNMAAYSAAKSAVIRMTESMAAELKNEKINVNCILPGTIDTPDNRAAMPKADHDRWVEPESLTEVILFLSSDAARDIHGAAVPVYGRS